jgi:hypothetical protein
MRRARQQKEPDRIRDEISRVNMEDSTTVSHIQHVGLSSLSLSSIPIAKVLLRSSCRLDVSFLPLRM